MSTLLLISLAAFLTTLIGGLFAIYFKDRLHLVLGFSAGAVIGVAFFELIPEAIELASASFDVDTVTMFIAIGFMVFMILDRFVIFHSHSHEESASNQRGVLGAGSFSIHSFLDGAAIGLAFQVSTGVGVMVAIAVLIHKFSDGINTVSMIIKNGGSVKGAFKWLFVNACAPVLGIFSTLFFSLPEAQLGILLALFSGFFIYIGASDLLPESHHSHPTIWTTVMTIVGISVLFIAIKIAHV